MSRNTRELFRYACAWFDIDKAKRILRRRTRPAHYVDPTAFREYFPCIAIDQDHLLSKSVDLRVPIIIGTLCIGRATYILPLDGWHRLVTAALLGRKRVRAYFLTGDETGAVHIPAPARTRRAS